MKKDVSLKEGVKKKDVQRIDAPIIKRKEVPDDETFNAARLFGLSDAQMEAVAQSMMNAERETHSMLEVADRLDLENGGKLAAAAFLFGQMVANNQMNYKMHAALKKLRGVLDDDDDS
jgi:hypothetical protein